MTQARFRSRSITCVISYDRSGTVIDFHLSKFLDYFLHFHHCLKILSIYVLLLSYQKDKRKKSEKLRKVVVFRKSQIIE
jgi:hypothetical protein